jgi:hypothetical protein
VIVAEGETDTTLDAIDAETSAEATVTPGENQPE